MAVSKVILNGTTLIDTTQKTVTAGSMLNGVTALKNDGTDITGNITSKTSSDLTASGATVTAPAGYYASSASKAVSSGSASTPATTITANPSISVSSGGLITASVSASKSVTPTVSAGYVSNGTAGTVSVSGGNTSQLTTQAAQTITPTTTNQTIASGKYLTGTQTILGDANLLAENIKKDVVIFGITGTYEGGGGGYEDITEEYRAGADYPDGHIFAYLNRATGEVIIGGQLNGGPYIGINGGLPVENCFGTCTITYGYYYDHYSDMTISNGVLTMPSLAARKNRVLFVILQAQGGGSIY